MKTNTYLGRKVSAIALTVIVCMKGVSPQAEGNTKSRLSSATTIQGRNPIEKSSCSKTLDISAMRDAVNLIISVPWNVTPTDSVPGHCVPGMILSDGLPAAPVNWWWPGEFGVPYKWDGLDDDVTFTKKHDSHFSAGLHGSERPNHQKCTTGLDCSGLASLAWGVGSTKHSTRDNDKSSLLAFAEQLDVLYADDEKTLLPDWYKHIAPGDLLVVPSHNAVKEEKDESGRVTVKEEQAKSGHVIVVSGISDKGQVCVYEASGHKKVWEKGTGKPVPLEWTAQHREIDKDYLSSTEPNRHWYVWHWCGGFANLPKSGTIYSCETPLRFPDEHYSMAQPVVPKKRPVASTAKAPKTN